MAFLIGTDEAGYGPNLGPLTICGTMWEADFEGDICLYKRLSDSVSSTPDPEKLHIADSKAVHKPKSIARLETNVLAMLYALHGRLPQDWKELLGMLSVDYQPKDDVCSLSRNPKLTIVADQEKVKQLAEKFQTDCQRNNVEFCNAKVSAVLPNQFNQQIDRLGNKAELLSFETLAIVKEFCETAQADVVVCCDKHGGRSKYAGMINQYLTDQIVRIDCESLQLSRYHWKERDRSVDVSFLAKGESFLPTALASMFAKYVREISMQNLNKFWQDVKPGIAPTKGYPVDAKRFKAEIADVQQELGITDAQIWRKR